MSTAENKKKIVKTPHQNSRTGAFGEEVTAQYLLARGDEILDRNWRVREGEIDIVTLGGDGFFHFTEVKTRSSLAFGHPLEAITPEKSHRMARLALAWLATHGCLGCDYRIDVVSILIGRDGSHTLEIRENIL
jgi:putative endonuclease